MQYFSFYVDRKDNDRANLTVGLDATWRIFYVYLIGMDWYTMCLPHDFFQQRTNIWQRVQITHFRKTMVANYGV